MSDQHSQEDQDNITEEMPAEEEESFDTEAGVNALVQELQAQVIDYEDRLKRAFAEQQNQRQRMLKDKANAERYGSAKLATDLLDVLDNLERALNAVPVSLQDNEPIQNVVTGVRMVQEQFLQVMNSHYILKLDPIGQMMDSNFHETLAEADGQDVPAGTVVDVAQAGYILHDRLLRPAKVVIASGRGSVQADDRKHIDQEV